MAVTKRRKKIEEGQRVEPVVVGPYFSQLRLCGSACAVYVGSLTDVVATGVSGVVGGGTFVSVLTGGKFLMEQALITKTLARVPVGATGHCICIAYSVFYEDAQNALLILLESLPEGVQVCFIVPHRDALIPTILSRALTLVPRFGSGAGSVPVYTHMDGVQAFIQARFEARFATPECTRIMAYQNDTDEVVHAKYRSNMVLFLDAVIREVISQDPVAYSSVASAYFEVRQGMLKSVSPKMIMEFVGCMLDSVQ